jgi:hypothetical protein
MLTGCSLPGVMRTSLIVTVIGPLIMSSALSWSDLGTITLLISM